MWTLHEGDCLDVMRQLESESVDAVITDPPYGIDYQSARRTDKSQWKPKIDNDKHPFVWWLYDAFRITKNGGVMACFCRWDVQDAFKQAIEWAGFTIKSQVIWDRGVHGMGDLKASFSPRHDVIWFATKGDYGFPGDRPSSVIRVQRVDAASMVHPNEKPVDLMRYLIRHLTLKSQVLVDFFAGSGATLLAAVREDRNVIGIEKDPKYCEIIRKRLSEPQNLRLFDAV